MDYPALKKLICEWAKIIWAERLILAILILAATIWFKDFTPRVSVNGSTASTDVDFSPLIQALENGVSVKVDVKSVAGRDLMIAKNKLNGNILVVEPELPFSAESPKMLYWGQISTPQY